MSVAEQNSVNVAPVVTSMDADREARKWGMFLHLSMCVPFVGLVAPIAIWQLKKDQFPTIDQHGKNAVNWIITEFIALVAASMLMFIIGSLPIMAICLVGLVFCIMAGIKANKGEVWKYPGSITFLK